MQSRPTSPPCLFSILHVLGIHLHVGIIPWDLPRKQFPETFSCRTTAVSRSFFSSYRRSIRETVFLNLFRSHHVPICTCMHVYVFHMTVLSYVMRIPVFSFLPCVFFHMPHVWFICIWTEGKTRFFYKRPKNPEKIKKGPMVDRTLHTDDTSGRPTDPLLDVDLKPSGPSCITSDAFLLPWPSTTDTTSGSCRVPFVDGLLRPSSGMTHERIRFGKLVTGERTFGDAETLGDLRHAEISWGFLHVFLPSNGNQRTNERCRCR